MLNYNVLYNFTENLTTKNNEPINNLITIILPLITVSITILFFYITYSKMKKPEQINLLHQIQVMYFDFFDKYTKAYAKVNNKDTKDIEIEENKKLEKIYYLNLLNVLEWYLFLKNKKQIDPEFDYNFDTFFRAVKSTYDNYKDIVLDNDYPLVKQRLGIKNGNGYTK